VAALAGDVTSSTTVKPPGLEVLLDLLGERVGFTRVCVGRQVVVGGHLGLAVPLPRLEALLDPLGVHIQFSVGRWVPGAVTSQPKHPSANRNQAHLPHLATHSHLPLHSVQANAAPCVPQWPRACWR